MANKKEKISIPHTDWDYFEQKKKYDEEQKKKEADKDKKATK